MWIILNSEMCSIVNHKECSLLQAGLHPHDLKHTYNVYGTNTRLTSQPPWTCPAPRAAWPGRCTWRRRRLTSCMRTPSCGPAPTCPPACTSPPPPACSPPPRTASPLSAGGKQFYITHSYEIYNFFTAMKYYKKSALFFTAIKYNKQETPQCDENQVFNDSTKYWCDNWISIFSNSDLDLDHRHLGSNPKLHLM